MLVMSCLMSFINFNCLISTIPTSLWFTAWSYTLSHTPTNDLSVPDWAQLSIPIHFIDDRKMSEWQKFSSCSSLRSSRNVESQNSKKSSIKFGQNYWFLSFFLLLSGKTPDEPQRCHCQVFPSVISRNHPRLGRMSMSRKWCSAYYF